MGESKGFKDTKDSSKKPGEVITEAPSSASFGLGGFFGKLAETAGNVAESAGTAVQHAKSGIEKAMKESHEGIDANKKYDRKEEQTASAVDFASASESSLA